MRKIALLLCIFLVVCFVCHADGIPCVKDITEYCVFTSSDHMRMGDVHDGKLMTYYTAVGDERTVTVKLPDRFVPGTMIIELYELPEHFSIDQYDKDGNLISAYDSASEDFSPLYRFYRLSPSAAKVDITLPEGSILSELHVYPAGKLPETVQNWRRTEKADVMLISTHQDDEELWFGGLLPYYGVQQEKSTLVVYMTNCGRPRIAEALRGLWSMGIRQYPEIIGLTDYSGTYDKSMEVWGGSEEIIGRMVEVIRKYRPEVIVTHDWDGEYGHNQHKITARHIEDAVKAAADPSAYPATFEKYGAWQTKKLYLHLSTTRPIVMNWDVPSDKLGGRTPYQLAEIGFSKHSSQLSRYNMEKGRLYKNNCFGLVYTTVGDDVYKDDFLENTPADLRK